MIKKAAIAVGVFAVSAMIAGRVAFAQTATPTLSPTPTTSYTSMTPTPTTSIPHGAPATGRE